MRWTIAALLLIATVAHAQTPLTGTTGAPTTAPVEQAAPPSAPFSAHRPHAHRTVQERFDEANTTHDGHLTLEQARSKMPAVARDFEKIDAGHKGYVTLDDIHAHTAAQRAARRAAKEQKTHG